MKVFLKARAWQLFALLITPFFAQVLFVPLAVLIGDLRVVMLAEVTLMALMMLVWVGWLFSVGKYANALVEPEIRMSSKLFGLGLGYALIYSFLFASFWFNQIQFDESGGLGLILPYHLLLPIHLLAMVATFYGLYFASKNLVMAEKQEKATIYDHVGAFLLMWFFPIGMWFIQPRVRKLMT